MSGENEKLIGGIWTAKQLITFLIGLALGIVFMVLPGFQFGGADALSHEGMLVLGFFLMAVVWWIGNPFPSWMTGLIMLTAMTMFGATKMATAFSAFSGSVIWVVIPALAIGTAMSKSGLLKRLVYIILSKFGTGYNQLVIGLLAAGTVTGPLIPSATAKVAIAAPLAREMSERAGFGVKTKAAAGLLTSTWIGFGSLGYAFLTGTVMTFVVIGLLPEDQQSFWTFATWILASLPWLVITFVGMFLAIKLLCAPKEKTKLDSSYLKEELDKLGKWSVKEKITLWTLLGAIVLWIFGTNLYSGLNTFAVAMIAMFILFGTKVLEPMDIKNGIAWQLIIFIASLVGCGSVFSSVGLTDWIGNSFGNYLAPVFSNVAIMVVAIVILTWLIRYVIVSQTALVTVVTLVSVPFCVASGISPWIAGFLCLVTCNLFCTIYQNATFVTCLGASNDMAEFKDCSKLSYCYVLCTLISGLASIPVWSLMGLC